MPAIKLWEHDTTVELDVISSRDPFKQSAFFSVEDSGTVRWNRESPRWNRESPRWNRESPNSSMSKREKDLYFFSCEMAGGAKIVLSETQEKPGITTYILTPGCLAGPCRGYLENGLKRVTEASDELDIPTILEARVRDKNSCYRYGNGKFLTAHP